MGKRYDEITPELQAFIERQPMYFVATAPADGHVNLSPKGEPSTVAVLGPDKRPLKTRSGENVTLAALLERLLHHAQVVQIQGGSYRLKDKRKAVVIGPTPKSREDA